MIHTMKGKNNSKITKTTLPKVTKSSPYDHCALQVFWSNIVPLGDDEKIQCVKNCISISLICTRFNIKDTWKLMTFDIIVIKPVETCFDVIKLNSNTDKTWVRQNKKRLAYNGLYLTQSDQRRISNICVQLSHFAMLLMVFRLNYYV